MSLSYAARAFQHQGTYVWLVLWLFDWLAAQYESMHLAIHQTLKHLVLSGSNVMRLPADIAVLCVQSGVLLPGDGVCGGGGADVSAGGAGLPGAD